MGVWLTSASGGTRVADGEFFDGEVWTDLATLAKRDGHIAERLFCVLLFRYVVLTLVLGQQTQARSIRHAQTYIPTYLQVVQYVSTLFMIFRWVTKRELAEYRIEEVTDQFESYVNLIRHLLDTIFINLVHTFFRGSSSTYIPIF